MSRQLKYFQTEKGKKALKKAQKKYFKSEKGKKALKKYQQSEKGKKAYRKALTRYINNNPDYWQNKGKRYYENNKDYFKDYAKKYNQSLEGKIVNSRRRDKRDRKLKNIPLFLNPFPDDINIHYHHINNVFTIPLPASLHLKTLSKTTDVHRIKCEKVISYLYNLDINKLLN